jgi:hypothetical protein
MIIIKYKLVDDTNYPERELTAEEKATVLGVVSNGLEYVYYQKQDVKAYNDFLTSLENE